MGATPVLRRLLGGLAAEERLLGGALQHRVDDAGPGPSVLPPVDRAVIRRGFASLLFQWIEAGLRPGSQGWMDDDLAFVRPWGFQAAKITVPVLVLQGQAGSDGSYAHGEWLSRNVSGAETILSDEDGRVSLLSNVGRVHDWLLAH